MPLDLKKVISQLKSLEKQETKDLNQQRLDSTYKVFQIACENKEKLIKRLEETKSTSGANFFFGSPFFEENSNVSLNALIKCDADFQTPHITIATDGSQINPSAHELTSASLINIGLVGIPYFERNISVLLSSEPTIYNSVEDVNPALSSESVPDEDLISYERTLKELEELVKLAEKYKSYNIPVVALLDGTLIHWHIEKFSSVFIKHFIDRFSTAISKLKALNIPVGSFLSNSRSNDLINMLKIFKCPYDFVDCKKHCSNLDTRNLPCNPSLDYKPVYDRRLIEKLFVDKKAETGTRTILFKSNSKILNYYPEDLKVFFFYINAGTEIARVEFPAYVAKEKKMLDLLHNAVTLQCKAGFGYPVTLSEAHLQAVVKRQDREIFYDLIREELLKTKNVQVRLSSKELRKRVSFV